MRCQGEPSVHAWHSRVAPGLAMGVVPSQGPRPLPGAQLTARAAGAGGERAQPLPPRPGGGATPAGRPEGPARAAGCPSTHARILDVHVAYLKDSVFLRRREPDPQRADGAGGAIAKVITDFDRIFRLVENESPARPRRRPARRRHPRAAQPRGALAERRQTMRRGTGPADYMLVARELSIVDMFNLDDRARRSAS